MRVNIIHLDYYSEREKRKKNEKSWIIYKDETSLCNTKKKKKQKQFLEIQCRKKTKIFQSLKIISTSESLTSIQGSIIRLNIYSNSNENQRNNDNEKYP